GGGGAVPVNRQADEIWMHLLQECAKAGDGVVPSPLCQLRTVREACQRRRRRRLEGRTGYQPAQQVEPDWEEEHQTEANSLSVSDGPRWHVSKVGTAEPAVVSRATGCGLCEMPCRLSEALDFTINCQVALAINSGCISNSRFRNALTTLSGWLSA